MSRRSAALRSMDKRYIAEDRFAIERRMHPFRKSPGVGRPVSADTLGDPLFQWFSTAVALGVVGLLVLITVILSLAAQDSIRTFGLGFLTGNVWNPVAPLVFGAVPFVYRTLVTSALALLFGVPISLGIAIFLSELSPPWLRIPLTYVVELLAAVPSVVYGLWGIFVLGPVMRVSVEPVVQDIFGFLPIFQGNPIGTDKFTAGVILAIMIIPTISAVSREALLAVPDNQREAALSLGATRWETTRVGVLRYAPAGIFGAIILALGRAVGEAMTVAAFLCVILALIPLGSLLFEASVRGLRSITPSFFTLTTANGGIGNAIQGTLILIALTAVIALPVGILTGIYLAEYGKNRVGAAVRFFVDVMTQIPSIVVGIFAFSLILELGATGIVSQRLVFSTTTGVIALSTIMIPFIARTSEEALRLVPISTRESALALGIPRYRAILRVVLPSSSSAVITGALLGIARVGGETAPLLMTCLGSPFWWQGLDQPCESLPHTIYVFALGPDSALNQAAWGASLILVLMMLAIAIVSRVVVRLRSVSR